MGEKITVSVRMDEDLKTALNVVAARYGIKLWRLIEDRCLDRGVPGIEEVIRDEWEKATTTRIEAGANPAEGDEGK